MEIIDTRRRRSLQNVLYDPTCGSSTCDSSIARFSLLPDPPHFMADIRIARPHGLPLSRAKAAAQAAADDLVREYAITCQWQGDTLNFRRSGVQGRIEVSPSQIAVEIRLGLLVRGFKSTIEQSVSKRLDELLAQITPAVAELVAPESGADGEEGAKVTV
jgi:putative polyhydroxyalkanoate system protein